MARRGGRSAVESKGGFACDPDGCVARLGDGTAVAVSRTAAALADDCARAALIVTLRAAPPDCAARVLDRAALRSAGATALTWRGGRFDITPARPAGFDRPWARRYETPARSPTNVQSLDATPPAPDTDAEQ